MLRLHQTTRWRSLFSKVNGFYTASRFSRWRQKEVWGRLNQWMTRPFVLLYPPLSHSRATHCAEKRNTFCRTLRYSDISILKMAAVRHLGIFLPPYETTLEVFVAGRSCLSNFMSIWYTDLKIPLFEFFAYFACRPKMGVLNLKDFGPLNVVIHHRDPKRHILA